MNPVAWKTCPDFKKFECCFNGDIRRKDGKTVILYLVQCGNKPERAYPSLSDHWYGHVYRQVFKAFGPPNPDPTRYTLIDHIDNDSLNSHINNLRWSNTPLNALNTDCFKGWQFDNSSNRRFKYKAQVKWLGKNYTLGRYKTGKEAESVYYACKGWIQQAFREHKYKDKYLAIVWRNQNWLRNFEVGADSDRQQLAVKNINRVLTNLIKYLKTENLISDGH